MAEQQEECIEEEKALKKAQELVTGLYSFNKHYFETHELSAAAKKWDEVREKMEHVLEELDQLQAHLPKAMAAYLRGKTLNILPDYRPDAEQLLSQAIKHNPSMVDAWNCLGECYWKSGNLQQAHHCFTGAIAREVNKESLRSLSMVLRLLSTGDKEANVRESVEKAKQAVSLDVKDGISWMIMGNAYLAMYFGVEQDPKLLKQCASAYLNAEKDSSAAFNSDLHFNKATLLLFEERYSEGLQSLEMAAQLDPWWTVGQNKLEGARKFLQDISRLVAGKGRLKAKRLTALVQSLQPQQKWAGRYASSHGVIGVRELQQRDGEGCLLIGVIAASATPEEGVPIACVLVDGDGECVCVTLYNLAYSAHLNIGDVLAIPSPSAHHVLLPNLEVDYWCVRVLQPQLVCYNRGYLPRSKLSRVELHTNN